MTTKLKHTPGPWIMEEWDDGYHTHAIVARGSVLSGRIAHITKWRFHQTPHDPRTIQQAANARLIAAAPEVLEALSNLLLVIKADALIPESVSYMREARAAIARAEQVTG